jgi:hypothetical protein
MVHSLAVYCQNALISNSEFNRGVTRIGNSLKLF